MNQGEVLAQLEKVLTERRGGDPNESYVAGLHSKGLNKILEKVGEECTEVLLAAKDANSNGNGELIKEIADLWFHCLVLLSHTGCSSKQVLEELQRRMGVSGLAEKAARDTAS